MLLIAQDGCFLKALVSALAIKVTTISRGSRCASAADSILLFAQYLLLGLLLTLSVTLSRCRD